MPKQIILNESEVVINEMYKDIMAKDGEYDVLASSAKLLSYTNGSGVITFMESAAIDSMQNELIDMYKTANESNFDKDLPGYTPFLTPTEYREEFHDKDISDFDYIMLRDPVAYRKVIRELYESPHTKKRDEKLLELGWIPQADPNLLNMNYARSRQLKWLKEHKPEIQFVDVSKLDVTEEAAIIDSVLEPIYICLSYTGTIFGDIINWWKKSKYSHAALSLNEKLDKMFTFNRNIETGESGFTIEGIQDYKNPKMNNDANLLVLGVFVTSEQKKKIKETLDWYTKNKRFTKYSFKNIANIVFNKTTESVYSLQMVCSQFVDNILKIANVDITRKSNNLVAPQDFVYTASPNNKVFILYEGLKSKYDPRKIKQKVGALLKSLYRNDLPKITAKEVATSMTNPTIDSFLVECTDDADKQNIFSEMTNILTPASILTEAKRIPVGFTKKGDIYIDTPKDLEAEYQEAHKLLSVYDESNLQGIKHELARLFYIVSIIDRRVKKMEDKSSVEYKDLIKLKARAMNDFTRYMKIVNKEEKNFDFSNYLKHTEYYDKTMIIGNDTLKYSGSFIGKAMKMIGL